MPLLASEIKFKLVVQSPISQIQSHKDDDDGSNDIDDMMTGMMTTTNMMKEVRIWRDSDFPNLDKAPNPQMSLIAFWTCAQSSLNINAVAMMMLAQSK